MMATRLVFKLMIRLVTSKPYDMMIKVMVTKMIKVMVTKVKKRMATCKGVPSRRQGWTAAGPHPFHPDLLTVFVILPWQYKNDRRPNSNTL